MVTVPNILPGITLSRQQRKALRQLEKFTRSAEKLHLLTGYAGTGKTTLLQALIKRMRDRDDQRPVVFTAFSNKATKVLERMSDQWNLGITCMTCCKLLGLRPDIDTATGQQIFKADRKGENLFDRYRLVVVDEASMINAEMWNLLVTAVSNLTQQTQILFVGDIAQLPPVNELESHVFSHIHNRSDLTEVMRYGGAIALLAETIRNNLTAQHLPEFDTHTNGDRTEGTFSVPTVEWERLMLKAFQSESYKTDPDYVRVVAYTNQRVNALNQKIRAAIHGERSPRFVPGERLVANTPYLLKDSVILQTSSECEVIDVRAGQEGSWSVWFLSVLTDEGNYRNITVLHEVSQPQFQRLLEAYAGEKRWQEFWELKNLFADLNYAYCLTIHKSQGSTFQNVFVDLPNALINRNIRERNQLLYVAVTRAAKRLFIPQLK